MIVATASRLQQWAILFKKTARLCGNPNETSRSSVAEYCDIVTVAECAMFTAEKAESEYTKNADPPRQSRYR